MEKIFRTNQERQRSVTHSRTLATKIFRTDEHWPLKKHNGRAEAALIAYHEGKIRYEKEQT